MRENEVLFFLLIVVMMRSRKTGSTGTAVSTDLQKFLFNHGHWSKYLVSTVHYSIPKSQSFSRLHTCHLGSSMPRWRTSFCSSALIHVLGSSTSSYSRCRPSYCQSRLTKGPRRSPTSGEMYYISQKNGNYYCYKILPDRMDLRRSWSSVRAVSLGSWLSTLLGVPPA